MGISLLGARPRRREFLVGLLLVACLFALASTPWFEPLDHLLLDLHFYLRGEIPFPDRISLIGVDEASLDVFGRWPWSRDKHAALVALLRNGPFRPEVLVYDLLFENKNPFDLEGDQAFVYQAVQLKSPLIMAYFFEKGQGADFERKPEKETYLQKFAFPPSQTGPENLEEADKVSLPFSGLMEATELAFVNTPVDPDGRTRRAQLLMKYEGRIYPSMDLLSAMHFLGTGLEDVTLSRRAVVLEKSKAGRITIPVNARGEMLIRYYGGADAIPSYSFVQVLDAGRAWMSGEAPLPLLTSLKGRVVLVGVTALGLGDRRVTSLKKYETGLSLHAQAIANILEGDFLAEAPPWHLFPMMAVTGLLTVLITMYLKITRSLPAVIALACGYFFIAHFLFLNGILVRIALPEIGVFVVFTGMISLRYFTALEELKRTQAELIQSAKLAALGQLSAGTAHEFRNILAAIGLHIEYCSQPDAAPEKLSKSMERIKMIMRNANQILNGLLIFARKSESVKQKGDLKKTIEDAAILLEKEMIRNEIRLTLELEEVPEMMYDHGQISQVIINLANNARDAFAKTQEKRLDFRLKKVPKGALIEIADNGKGIPPEIMKNLFQPFMTSKPGQGTGLGLSICHGIVRNHGGEISVTTSAGQGTAWHIFLPAS